eukprot:3375935-Rhodomonas_salina.9
MLLREGAQGLYQVYGPHGPLHLGLQAVPIRTVRADRALLVPQLPRTAVKGFDLAPGVQRRHCWRSWEKGPVLSPRVELTRLCPGTSMLLR